MSYKIELRNGTGANWVSANPVLAVGEIGIVTDAGAGRPNAKIGDGVTAWSSLEWWNPEGASVFDPVTLFDADTTGTTDATNAFQNCLSLIPSYGGVVAPRPGLYKISSTLFNEVTPTWLRGYGRWATMLNFTGTGDCLRMFNPRSGYGSNAPQGGGVQDLTIDGTSAGNGSTGLHIGDGSQYELNVAVQNFSGTGSIGVHADNTIWWTEKMHGTIFASNNTQGVVFDVTNPFSWTGVTLVSASGGTAVFSRSGGWNIPGTSEPLAQNMFLTGSAGLTTPLSANVSTLKTFSASGNTLTCSYTGTAPSGTTGTLTLNSSTNSFGYTDLICYINAKAANQDGVVLQNGARVYHQRSLGISGNFVGSSSSQSSYVLRVTGQVPVGNLQSGGYSKIDRGRLDIQVEANGGSGSNAPGTIFIGTQSNNGIFGCYGVMSFSQGGLAFVGTNAPANSSHDTFYYMGIIDGDNNLNPGALNLPITLGAHLYSAAPFSGSTGGLAISSGDFYRATLSANITVNLNADGNPNGMPQRKTVIITQAASGGPYTVTWPHAGSPTTTSPTVLWAGGTAPTMSAGANAVDVYELSTYTGATWYGSALQNVS